MNVGNLIYNSLRAKPSLICQVDAKTGESETFESVLNRSVCLAKCFRQAGLKVSDVMALSGRNHLDLYIPFYAALMTGIPIAGIDSLFKFDEIKRSFALLKPAIAFCQSDSFEDTSRAVKELNLDTQIVTFEDGEYSMRKFLQLHDDTEDGTEFSPTELDCDQVFVFLLSTSGTTGGVKFAAFHHAQVATFLTNLLRVSPYLASSSNQQYIMSLSPVQWLTGSVMALLAPSIGCGKVQTSAVPCTPEHVIDIINKYKPISGIMSPSLATQILRSAKECDWKCFNHLSIVGSKVPDTLLPILKKKLREENFVEDLYGQTETLGACTFRSCEGPPGNCGRAIPGTILKLIDPSTGEEIKEPYRTGELLVKGRRFVEYYKMPEETKKCFTDDGFYRTGDLLYRDENDFYYFVDRLKTLIKYRNYHIIPKELEEILLKHDGISEVVVLSVPDAENGELPVACVVRTAGSMITAQEIKDIIANQLSDSQQLRGGVVFMDSLPRTSTDKIALEKLREFILNAERE